MFSPCLSFFPEFIFSWRVIALQFCVGCYHISTWISHRYMHIPSLLNLPPHPTHLGCHRTADWSSLHHKANFHQLSDFTDGSVYVSMLLTQFVPPSPCPCVHKSTPYMSPLLPCRYVYHISRLHIYTLISEICFSLSDWLHSVIGSRFIHLIRTEEMSSFLWLSNIPLCICTTTSLSIHLLMDIYVASMP